MSSTRRRAKPYIRRTRPAWWSQEGVLARLQAGEYIGAICQAASDEMAALESEGGGLACTQRTLRSEVTVWSQSASWGEQFTKALKLCRFDQRGQMVYSKDWHDEFIAAMHMCGGDAKRAAEMCGVSHGIVLAVIDKRNGCYDPEFHERYRIALTERVANIHDSYLDYAENGTDDNARLRVQEKVLSKLVPSLHGTRQELHVTGEIAHDHDHAHSGEVVVTHRVELAKEVLLASRARVQALHGARGGASAVRNLLESAADDRDRDDRVIDVTPTPVRETTETRR